MAAAIKTSVVTAQPPGARRYSTIDLTPSTSYPALGEPITPGDFGFSTQIDSVVCSGDPSTTTVHVAYDPTNKSIRLYTASTGAEVATTSDQSLKKLRLTAFGF